MPMHRNRERLVGHWCFVVRCFVIHHAIVLRGSGAAPCVAPQQPCCCRRPSAPWRRMAKPTAGLRPAAKRFQRRRAGAPWPLRRCLHAEASGRTARAARRQAGDRPKRARLVQARRRPHERCSRPAVPPRRSSRRAQRRALRRARPAHRPEWAASRHLALPRRRQSHRGPRPQDAHRCDVHPVRRSCSCS